MTSQGANIRVGIALLLVLACAPLLAGCGVRGAPEMPPGETVTDEEGREVQLPSQPPDLDRPFILDGLL